MRFLFALSDEKFIKHQECDRSPGPLDTYQYRVNPFLKGKSHFDKNALPHSFKTTPDTLLNLCAKVVDALPLPPVYKWTNVDVCIWIRKYGYPQYRETFRENMINGRTLLLLDAAALCAMNIQNFNDIKHIAQGIRGLFFFELTKFSRSISLPPHFYYELYKLYRVKNGYFKFEQVRRTDLWRKMQLLREKEKNLMSWELLENWLSLKPDPIFRELFGGYYRHTLYKCRQQKESDLPLEISVSCTCSQPCECYWTEERLQVPQRLKILQSKEPVAPKCTKCHPVCYCHWKPKYFNQDMILSCLLQAFPIKYKHRAHHMNIRFKRSVSVPVEPEIYNKAMKLARY